MEYVWSLLPDDARLSHIESSIAAAALPNMSVKPDLGKLLSILTATCQAKQALEIGTFAGYSAICIASSLPADGRLTSLEYKQAHADLARVNLQAAGLDDKVELLVGDALSSLQTLTEAARTYDLIFIDADKPNYPAYLEHALTLAKTGTLIVADNVLLRDRVIDETNHNPSPTAMRKFNQTLMTHPRLDATILPVHDGIAIARVR